MQEGDLIKNNLVKWLLIIGVWAFVAVIFAFKSSLSASSMGKDISLIQSLQLQSLSCLGWVILTPLILWSTERFLPEGKGFYRKLFLLVLCGIGIMFLQTAYQAVSLPLFGFPPNKNYDSFIETYQNMLVSNWLLSLSLYAMTLGVILVATYYRKYQHRELLSSKLETNLNRARLQLLKMQLHPHFLFNTHNAISELIHSDPNTAERMLTNLSDLLRISLDKLEVEEVSLSQELEFVEKYIEIEQMRFQERLRFKLNIASDTLDAIVPNMLLQPLIENAVKHGITPLKEGGTIKLTSYKQNNKLHIKVSDDGIGLLGGGKKFVVEGIGLSNIKARLLHLYKDAQRVEINSNREKGFIVLLIIPFKKAEEKLRPHLALVNAELVSSN